MTDVLAALQAGTFPVHNEDRLQQALAEVLTPFGFVREYVIAEGRLDFYRESDQTAIEVKVQGRKAEVARQLGRYAECAQISQLILVTSKPTLADVPASLCDKPIYVIKLYQSIL